MMKKLSTFIVCLMIVQMAAAQDVRVGVRAGGNLANQQIENEALDLFNAAFESKNHLGWQAGLLVEVPLSRIVTLQPALLLNSKGFDYEDANFFGNLEIESRPLYLNIPLPVLAYGAVQNWQVFAGVGPYIGFGIGGEIESSGDIVQIGFANEGDIAWGEGEEDSYRVFDWGAVFTAGVEYRKFQLALAYELGLANIHPQDSEDNRIFNRAFSLTTSYFILQ